MSDLTDWHTEYVRCQEELERCQQDRDGWKATAEVYKQAVDFAEPEFQELREHNAVLRARLEALRTVQTDAKHLAEKWIRSRRFEDRQMGADLMQILRGGP